MLSTILLLAMTQVHVTIHVVPQERCSTLAERLAFLEGRMATAEQLPSSRRTQVIIDDAPPPTQLPAPPNGCYAAPAAAPSAYAAPQVYQQRGVPLGYVTIDRRTDYGSGQYASIERRGLLGQTRFAARSSPLGMQIERRGLLGQRLMLNTSACGPYGCFP